MLYKFNISSIINKKSKDENDLNDEKNNKNRIALARKSKRGG